MPIIHAVILGIVQGLSEFLPISSSGHLLLVPWLFGWNDFVSVSVEKAFDVALHLGTLIAALVYFRKEVKVYVRDGLQLVIHRERPTTPEGRLAWLLVLSALPGAAVGALLEKTIDDKLGKPALIAVGLIVFGLVLWYADALAGKRAFEEYSKRDAIMVGAAQVLALNPGTSRSGITITAGRFLGFSRDAAARVSFLMSLPITAGAVAYKGLKLAIDGIPHGLAVPMLVGIITSGLTGWLAVWGTLKWVRTRSFAPFVIYRIALGVTILVIVACGWR